MNYKWFDYSIPGAQLCTILNRMPNLEELKLANLKVNPDPIAGDELHLPKLRKLSLSRCEFSTELLKCFPSNILLELTLDCNEYVDIKRCIQDFLDRQPNITKLRIVAFRHLRVKLNLDHLKLQQLEVHVLANALKKILKHQTEIRSLFVDYTFREKISFRRQLHEVRYINLFNTLRKLDKLEFLKFRSNGTFESQEVIKAIGNLTSLKTLLIEDHPGVSSWNKVAWSAARMPLLERLDIDYCRPEKSSEEVARLGISFPRLKHLMAWSSWFPQLVNILDTFPDLETLQMCKEDHYLRVCFDQVVIRDGFSHINLKQLVVGNSSDEFTINMPQLLRIVNACPNLERLMLYYSSSVDTEAIRDILETHPNLTHLCLDADNFQFTTSNFRDDAIDVIKTLGRKLVHFQLKDFICELSETVNLQQAFRDQFDIVKEHRANDAISLVMKKRNAPKWDAYDFYYWGEWRLSNMKFLCFIKILF